jgi:acetolactate synthase-1/3 small subunit
VKHKHTISVLVEDKPGALARIATMFARRGFNIDSLAVGPTERQGVSCITLRVDCEHHTLEQIEKQIHKLVNVLRVTELTPGEAVERELLLLKVSAAPDRRAELVSTAEAFKGRVVDLGPDAIVFELTGTPEELDSFQELARPHGIQELVRTGRVGMSRASTRGQARRLSAIN